MIAFAPLAATRLISATASCGSQLGHDRQRQEAIRIGAAPVLDVPVVVGPDDRIRGLVLDVAEVAGAEPGERREAHRRRDAVDVHVANAGMDVVRTGAHLVEPGGVETPLRLRPRHDGVQADDTGLVAAVHPAVDAVVVLHDPRRVVDVLGREAAVEHVGRLDDVVVDAHQDKIVNIHDSLLSCSRYDRLCTIGQSSCSIGRPSAAASATGSTCATAATRRAAAWSTRESG